MTTASLEDDIVAAGDLVSRYAEPHRRYHTLTHIQAVLASIDELAASEGLDDAQRQTARLAGWFHDAVYDPTRHDNEQRSADLARATLMQVGVLSTVIDDVLRLILVTAHHTVADGDAVGAVVVDADLAILAARPDRYDTYAAAVRQEYSHVPDEAYRSGRSSLLQHLLGQDPLFHTGFGRLNWERAARYNMQQELAGYEG